MSETQPTGGFQWTQEPWGLALQCPALGEAADHFFTTRQLRLGGSDSGPSSGWDTIARRVGVGPGALVRLRQVHGAAWVALRREQPARAGHERPEADIVLTDNPAVAVAVQVADCVPLLIADPRTGAVAAVHAGWRGTAAGVAGVAVDALRSTFGAHPADLIAAVGPSIGPCCYVVGSDVVDRVRDRFGDEAIARWFSPADQALDPPTVEAAMRARGAGSSRASLDLWQATRDQLMAAGLNAEKIYVARLCTATHRELFCSYRAEGPGVGRMAGVIRPRRS